MDRQEIFVQEGIVEILTDTGVSVEVSVGKNGQLVIMAYGVSEYSDDYMNPYIPDGYVHVGGEWKNGFSIERKNDGSRFVWCPVGYLDSDATLNGKKFDEKFGRRTFGNKYSLEGFDEPLTGEFLEVWKSVKKYGGFYISAYQISKSSKGKPHSKKWSRTWNDISFEQAVVVANSFETREDLKSHLPYGAEYDSILAWFIKSEAKTLYDVAVDSSNWGNYMNTENSHRACCNTGHNMAWCANNVYDIAGNLEEFTQERDINRKVVVRGGGWDRLGNYFPAACRYEYFPESHYDTTGFRIVLYKPVP